ncbi:hypothetical protein MASR1M45_25430 [Candidatus Kapaibacterium sp.]
MKKLTTKEYLKKIKAGDKDIPGYIYDEFVEAGLIEIEYLRYESGYFYINNITFTDLGLEHLLFS